MNNSTSTSDHTDEFLDIACQTRQIVQTILNMQDCDNESRKSLNHAAKQLSQAMDSFIGDYIISSQEVCRDLKAQLHDK